MVERKFMDVLETIKHCFPSKSDSFLHVKMRLTIAAMKEQINCRRILATITAFPLPHYYECRVVGPR